jgi:hypothetical protein
VKFSPSVTLSRELQPSSIFDITHALRVSNFEKSRLFKDEQFWKAPQK